MGWAKIGLAGGVLGSVLAMGCQSKLYEQNKQLMEENKELRAQNDRSSVQTTPQPAQPVVVQQPVVQPAPPPVVSAPTDSQPSAPTQANHPASIEQIGGLETTLTKHGNTVVHLPSDVFFDPGQATLKASAKTSLDKVIAALNKKFSGKKLIVEGHTDSTPIRVSKWASNQELSEARAKAVKDYLVAKGVEPGRLVAVGKGMADPVVQCDEGDKAELIKCLEPNRRVDVEEIVIERHVPQG